MLLKTDTTLVPPSKKNLVKKNIFLFIVAKKIFDGSLLNLCNFLIISVVTWLFRI